MKTTTATTTKKTKPIDSIETLQKRHDAKYEKILNVRAELNKDPEPARTQELIIEVEKLVHEITLIQLRLLDLGVFT